MTPGDTARVLSKCAAFDNRSIDDPDVAAWHEVLANLELQDALAAVTAHYREQTQRAMPADIRRLAISERDRRQSAEHQRDRRQAIEAAPTTHDRSTAVAAMVHQVAAALPSPDLHQRAQLRARQERGRPPTGLRKSAKRDAKPAKDYPAPDGAEAEKLARRYLLDGWEPDALSDRLGISRKWLRRAARKLGANPEIAAEVTASSLRKQLAARGIPPASDAAANQEEANPDA
jgi:hypothetical protein